MAHISTDDLLKLAQLSKLELTDAQITRFQAEIGEIVDYVEQLQMIDVTGLEPTQQVTGLSNVMREDEVLEYVSNEALLKNAPATQDNLIKVKRVLE